MESDEKLSVYTDRSLRYASDLAIRALGLAELMDITSKKMVDGIEVEFVRHRLDYFSSVVREVQVCAKYASEEIDWLVVALKDSEEENQSLRETLKDYTERLTEANILHAKETLKEYAKQLSEAEQEIKRLRALQSTYYGLYEDLWLRSVSVLSEEKKEEHMKLKSRVLAKLKK